jgi:hypothetical protein
MPMFAISGLNWESSAFESIESIHITLRFVVVDNIIISAVAWLLCWNISSSLNRKIRRLRIEKRALAGSTVLVSWLNTVKK